MEYRYSRRTQITILNNPHDPQLLAYSRMINRLEKLRNTGKCEFSGMGDWGRYTFKTATGNKMVQVSDRVYFPGDDIKYSVSIHFYSFKNN